MARLKRLEVPHWPHLLVQHAAVGQPLVHDAVDRQMLWMAMLDAAQQTQVSVHAYVILSDHFHVLVTPHHEGALSLFMQAIGRRYVARYNHRHGHVGKLWAGRFKGTVLSPQHSLTRAMVFIETHDNGLSTPLVESQEIPSPSKGEFGHSSLSHHLNIRTDPLVHDHDMFWKIGNTPFERESQWRAQLQTGLTPDQRTQLAHAMNKGWALLNPEQCVVLEKEIGRRLTQRPSGRPRITA